MSTTDQDPLRQALTELDPGFELVRELGRGATAIVYLVRDQALGRNMAVKVIRSSFGSDPEAMARLQREARLVAQLQHPNIVRLFGVRTLSDGSMALLMEHVPGQDLKALVQEEGALDVGRVLGVLRDIGEALAYAHRRRIVHRDVKPENIYLDDEVGTARLADFGVARPWDRDTRLTLPGESLGTPAYMSPEQIDDREVDGRTDLYSLGLVGYEMLAGRHPWESDNLFSIIFKQKNEPLPPLGSLRRDVPADVIRLLERALQKDPEARWASAETFLERIEQIQAEERGDPPRAARSAPADPLATAAETAAGSAAAEAAKPGTGASDDMRPATAASDRASPPRDASGPPPPPPRGPIMPPERDEPDTTAPPASEVPPEPIWPHGPAASARPPASGPASPVRPGMGMRRRRGPPGGRRRWATAAGLAGLVALVAGWWYLGGGSDADAGTGVVAVPSSDASAEGVADGPEAGADGGEAGAADPSNVAAEDLVVSAAGPVTVAATVGQVVPLEVRVRDGEGTAMAGVLVRFTGSPEGAAPESDTVRTDSLGLARADVRLPTRPGTSRVVAGLAMGGEARASFEVRARSGEAAALESLTGDGQAGTPSSLLDQPLGVRVADAEGNPVPGGVVLFQPTEGAGEVLPDRALTDSLGRAFARWRLGPGSGAQTVRATVANVEGVAPVQFRAEAVATVPAGNQDLAEAAVDALTPPADTADTAETVTTPEGPPETDAPPSTYQPPAGAPVRVAARGMSVGGTHVCHVGEAGVRCRGANDRGQARSAPRPTTFVSVAGGVSHTCALDAQGTAFCWGANASGQIGDGSRADRTSPTEVATQVALQMVTAGLAHTCALDGSGAAFCWGRNVGGQLGDASRDDRTTPVRVSGGRRFRSLVAGWNHTCGVEGGGEVWCWGLNSDGQLGDGTRLDRLVPTSVPGAPPFQVLAAGNGHTCGVTGGQVRCWGDNRFGQLGTGDQQSSSRPASPVDLPDAVTRVAAGAVHTCALLGDGRAFCWGQNVHGQLGDGSTTSRSVPTAVAGDVRFRSLYAGGGSTCGVSTDGAEYCWGLNQTGQLGDGSRTNRTLPTPVGGDA